MAGPVEKALAGKTPAEQGRTKGLAFLRAPTPTRWTTEEGVELRVVEKSYVEGRGLRVLLESDEWEVEPLHHGYYWPSPRIKVPDGDEPDPDNPGQSRTKFREDLAEAFKTIVTQAARHYHSNPEVWGRTTTTFYSSTDDSNVESADATYSTARAGSNLAAGGSSNLRVGQRTGYVIDEAFVSFDTSALPDGDTIDSAVLSMYGAADDSTTDFTIQARIHDWGASVTTADWVAGANLASKTLVATFATSGFSTSAYNVFTSDAAFVANVSKTGTTYILFNSSRHEAGTTPTNNERVTMTAAEAVGTTQDPKLVVNHSVASQTVAVAQATETDTANPMTLVAGATSVAVAQATETDTANAMTASQTFRPRAGRRKGRIIPRVIWTVDDREVPAADWRASTIANGGYDTARLLVPEKYASTFSSSLQQMAPVRAFEETGALIWEGRLVADPAIDNARAQLEAGGYMHSARKRFGRLLYQTFDTSHWADETSSPYEQAGASTISVSSGDGRLEWRADQGQTVASGDEHSLVFWAPETDLGRFACTLLVSGTATDYTLNVYRLTGPSGTRTLVGGISLTSGTKSVTTTTREDAFAITLKRTGANHTRTDTLRVIAYRARVNDLSPGDTLESENIASDVGRRLGWDVVGVPVGTSFNTAGDGVIFSTAIVPGTGGVLSPWGPNQSGGTTTRTPVYASGTTFVNVAESALNVLPIDWTGRDWGSLLDYLALITDYRWRVLGNVYGAGPIFQYGPWGPGRTVYQAKNATAVLRPQERFNRVVVKYPTTARGENEWTEHADPDPFERFRIAGQELVNAYEERIQDPQANSDFAERVAQVLLPRLTEPRLAGTVDIVGSDAGSPYSVIAGDTVRVSDHPVASGMSLRVSQTEMTPEGVSLGVENPVSAAGLLALAQQEYIRRPFGAIYFERRGKVF